MLNYRLIRSRRKTFAIEIDPDGSLLVRAPLRVSGVVVEALIHDKTPWIERKLEEFRRRESKRPAHQFKENENFPYIGQLIPLILSERLDPALAFENGCFILSRHAQSRARQIFETWYRAEAARVFSGRLILYKSRTGLSPSRLRISSARTRWGSCSSKGTLSLTYRLVMAPLAVIDYVILHELAHLRVKNHSPAFWSYLKTISPDYATQRNWLKKNGHSLNL